MKFRFFEVLIGILYYNSICAAYNILGVFHAISQTQFQAGSILIKELAKRGHNITTVSPFHQESPRKNVNEIVLDGVLAKNKEYLDNYRGVKSSNLMRRFLQFYEIGDMMTTATLQHPKFQRLLKLKQNFDLILIDATMNDAILGLAEYFKTPVLEYDTSGVLRKAYDFQGYERCLYSSIVREPIPSNPGFYDRLTEAYFSIIELLYINYIYLPRQIQLRHIYFPMIKNLEKDNLNIPTLQLDRDFIGIHNNIPNQIRIENLTPKVHKSPIPKLVKEFMDTASNGVIYVSLELTNSELSNETLYNIMGAFNKRKESVLWKTYAREFEFNELPENVLISTDAPLTAVLGHPKIKLFINEGNLDNILHTATHGVPVIGITEFVEQSYNLVPLIRAGAALQIDVQEMNESILSDTIEIILSNSNYSKFAKIVSEHIQSMPFRTEETAAAWVEYIIRTKDTLPLNTRRRSFLEVYNIDIIAFLVMFIGFSTYVVGIIVKKILVMAVLFYLNVNVKEKQM